MGLEKPSCTLYSRLKLVSKWIGSDLVTTTYKLVISWKAYIDFGFGCLGTRFDLEGLELLLVCRLEVVRDRGEGGKLDVIRLALLDKVCFELGGGPGDRN